MSNEYKDWMVDKLQDAEFCLYVARKALNEPTKENIDKALKTIDFYYDEEEIEDLEERYKNVKSTE